MTQRTGGRAVEGARLESVYTFKAYRGFESPSVRQVAVLRHPIKSKKCHESPAILFGGKLQTKDLRKTIYEMYRVDSSEKPSKAQVDAMFKYAKSFKK